MSPPEPLTILSVAYPLAPVASDTAGGAEQVLSLLDQALVRAGHRSLVIACEGSRCAGELIATPRLDRTLRTHLQPAFHQRHRATIENVLANEVVDLVHFHGIDFASYLPRSDVPVLATLHLPPAWYIQEAMRLRRPGTYFNCVSCSQQRSCPPGLPLLPVIENGIPVDAFDWAGPKSDYVAWIGRICPEKAPHLAIAAARRARISLRLAGKVFPFVAHQQYFAEHIEPLLASDCCFVGSINLAQKRELLGAARALLLTSTAPETSSLVAMEAMASGTPVIAFPVGALPEIVEHGRTGFLVHDFAEMAEAIGWARSLDPADCRKAARQRFSAERMAASYLARYAELARADRASSAPALQERFYVTA